MGENLLKMKYLIFPFIIFLSCVACDKNDDGDFIRSPNSDGLAVSLSESNFENTYSKLIATLEDNDKIGIVAEVDHSSNAAGAGLALPDTKVVLFGNPTLGTPLMQENQLAGLDLPQKMLVYQEDDQVYVVYNRSEYLAERHNLTAAAPQLEMISNALRLISFNATAKDQYLYSSSVTPEEGVITVSSENPFERTYNKVKGAIEMNANLTIMAELDHQTNAASVGKELRPTRLIVFGNPNLGTPLIQRSRTVAVDLPQKMLVWEDEVGTAHISYNDPKYLVKRHGITDNDEIINNISNALAGLSKAAAK